MTRYYTLGQSIDYHTGDFKSGFENKTGAYVRTANRAGDIIIVRNAATGEEETISTSSANHVRMANA